LGETRDFALDDLVEAHWESLTMQSWRDVWIVIIGTLVALGAAMVVESVRPLVDRFVEAHEVKAHRVPAITDAPAAHSDSAPGPPAHGATTTSPQSSKTQPEETAVNTASPSELPPTPPQS
jgi:hypothetical protein